MLNSHSLYGKNEGIYKDFFANYPLVLSAPGGAIISGAFSHQFGGIGLHHKIPLRNYIGIKLSNNKRLQFKHFGTYDIYRDSFITDVPLDGLEVKLNYLWEKVVNKSSIIGLEIGLLNEIPRRHGLNNPGVNAVNLAIAYLLLTNQLDIDTLNQFQNNSDQVDKTAENLIKSTVKEFHAKWIGPNNSGFGALACLSSSKYPIVYENSIRPLIKPICHIFGIPEDTELPYDIVIIGTSDRNDIDFRLHAYDHLPDIFTIKKYDINKITEHGFRPINSDEAWEDTTIINQYRKTIDATATATVLFFGQYLKNNDVPNLEKFFSALNNSYSSLNLMGNKFLRKTKVTTYIQEFFYSNLPDVPFAITTSIANHLILFVIKEHFRESLPRLENHLSERLNFNISYPFISWRDGYESSGVVIEQWLSKDIVSQKFPGGSLYIKYLEPLKDSIAIQSIRSIDRLEFSVDLLFNEDDNKIYINGERVSSKELPSTQAAIILLDHLLKSDQKVVESNNLPSLSYFQDRNELQSKIISPLKMLSEKHINKSLNLKINGSITDFKVMLLASDLSIGLVKRSDK